MTTTVGFSIGRNARHADKLEQVRGSFDDLVQRVQPNGSAKKDGPYICGPLRGGRRNTESAEPIAFVALDLDTIHDEVALAAIVEAADRWQGVGYTTYSHRPEAGINKCRLIFALDREATRAEYPRLCQAVAAGLSRAAQVPVEFDPSCAKPEQPLYTARQGATVWRFDGEPVRVDQALRSVPDAPQAAAAGLEHIKSTDPVLRALRDQGRILRDLGAGKFAIRCPFVAEHSREHAPDDSSTVYLLPNTGGYARGHFVCQHAHCAKRTDDAFRAALGLTEAAPKAAPIGPEMPKDSALADFANPVEAAQSIVAMLYTRDGLRTLHYWQGDFHTWTGSHYVVLPVPDVRELLYRLGPACSKAAIKKARVDDVLDALRAASNLSHLVVPSAPAWIGAEPGAPDPRALIPVANGVLRTDDGALTPATPRLFVPYCLPFDYERDAPAPLALLTFLASVWKDDIESIHCLQEWLGYLLTADTSQQKALMIVGPPRSGKGTIGRLIGKLLGPGNVASPTLSSLGQPFGLQVLIGKTAALVSDARLGAHADIAAIAENLLRITGEDEVSVDRKFQTAYTARLLSRLILLANELPTFRDAASALPSRFVILRTTRSFLGNEDHQLEAKLNAELPSILAWALVGLRRLRARGRFVQPKSSTDAVQLMEDLASPIRAFLRERCVMQPGAAIPVQAMYAEWRDWCQEHGRDQPGTEQTFGRDMAAAAPSVRVIRPRINGARPRHYSGVRLRGPDDPTEVDDDELPL